MHRVLNYLGRTFPLLRRFQTVENAQYTGRHRSTPRVQTQYAHDVTSTGTIVVVPRARRNPVEVLRSIRHREPSSKEPASTVYVGRVSRHSVDLIATVAITLRMVAEEQFLLRLPPSRALPMYPSHT